MSILVIKNYRNFIPDNLQTLYPQKQSNFLKILLPRKLYLR